MTDPDTFDFGNPNSVVAFGCSRVVIGPTGSALILITFSERCEPLLLCDGVDVRADDEGNDVEEWHPSVFGKELLRKRQG